MNTKIIVEKLEGGASHLKCEPLPGDPHERAGLAHALRALADGIEPTEEEFLELRQSAQNEP
jgi:hypothetical protein